MNILLFLIPLSLVLLLTAVAAFVWAVRSGQFEDMDSAAIDILSDAPLHDTSGDHGTRPEQAEATHPPDSSGHDGHDTDHAA